MGKFSWVPRAHAEQSNNTVLETRRNWRGGSAKRSQYRGRYYHSLLLMPGNASDATQPMSLRLDTRFAFDRIRMDTKPDPARPVVAAVAVAVADAPQATQGTRGPTEAQAERAEEDWLRRIRVLAGPFLLMGISVGYVAMLVFVAVLVRWSRPRREGYMDIV